MYIKNNTGLKTKRCGTPYIIGSIYNWYYYSLYINMYTY